MSIDLNRRGAECLVRTHDIDAVYETLERDLERHVAASASPRVFVHAGVVGWRGKAIVLPGRTLAGKSTLVAALVQAGATYYSDEYAVFDVRGRVHPFARPLKLRPPSRDALGSVPPPPVESAGKRPLRVGLVALTHYSRGARWRSQAVSPGQAVLALMEHTLTMRCRPEVTFQALREVVRHARVIQGVRGEVETAVERLLGQSFGPR
jgi:hypothetical protein